MDRIRWSASTISTEVFFDKQQDRWFPPGEPVGTKGLANQFCPSPRALSGLEAGSVPSHIHGTGRRDLTVKNQVPWEARSRMALHLGHSSIGVRNASLKSSFLSDILDISQGAGPLVTIADRLAVKIKFLPGAVNGEDFIGFIPLAPLRLCPEGNGAPASIVANH